MLAYDYPLLGVFWSLIMLFMFVMVGFAVIYTFIDNFRRSDHSGAGESWVGAADHRAADVRRAALHPHPPRDEEPPASPGNVTSAGSGSVVRGASRGGRGVDRGRRAGSDRAFVPRPLRLISYFDVPVKVHRPARKHGVTDDDVLHAVTHEIVSIDLEPDTDPPKSW